MLQEKQPPIREELKTLKEIRSQGVPEVNSLKEANAKLSQQLQVAQDEIADLRQQRTRSDGVPSFSAIIPNDASFDNNAVVIFNEALHNPDGLYNTATGRFTCPVEGQYFFSWTIDSRYLPHDNQDHNTRNLATLRVDGAIFTYGPIVGHDRHNDGDNYEAGSSSR